MNIQKFTIKVFEYSKISMEKYPKLPNFYLIFYPNFKISRKSDTQIWSKFCSFGYFSVQIFEYPKTLIVNFWIFKKLDGKLDKNIQNYQILTKFEYLIFWICKNLDKKLDKNLSKQHGRSSNLLISFIILFLVYFSTSFKYFC